jgi:hypothetical protein
MPAKQHQLKRDARRPGPQRGETARRPRKRDRNFKQSRDVREDRGVRQIRLASEDATLRRGRPGAA